jgi:hypothetical protein
VLHLRESAQKVGLLRKYRGRLIPTPCGRTLRSDPLGLWWHIAEKLPWRSTDEADTEAGLLLLIAMGAQVDDVEATITDLLGALGWMQSDGAAVTGSTAWPTEAVLRRLSCFTDARSFRRSAKPTAEGVEFARAALQTWP